MRRMPSRTGTKAPTRWRTRPRRSAGIRAPNLASLGLGLLTTIRGVDATPAPGSAHGRATERSAGKDTTTGHWEMMGIRLDEPFPLYPDGFPPDLIGAFERDDRPHGAREPAGLGHGDHRRARRGASADGEPDRLHVRRFRLPDRDAQVGRRPRRSSTSGRASPAGSSPARTTSDG